MAFWLQVREKLDMPLSMELFVKLNDILLDETPLFLTEADPSNENTLIVLKDEIFFLYFGGKKFLKTKEAHEAVISAILLNHIFVIDFPSNLRNLGIFLSYQMGLDSLLGPNETLPRRALQELEKVGLI